MFVALQPGLSSPFSSPFSSPLALAGFALRLVLACMFVLAISHWFGRPLVQAMLPLLKSALAWFASDFYIHQLALVQQGPDTALQAIARLDHTLVLGEVAVVPDFKTGYFVTTTLGTVLQPLLTALVLVMAWPARVLAWLLRLVLAGLLLLPLMLLDAPLYLFGSLWDMQVKAHAPGSFYVSVWWMSFLSGGGRLVLGLAAGGLAVALVNGFTAWQLRRRTKET
jgi:hypothetical protein